MAEPEDVRESGLPLAAAERCRIRKTADASLPESPVARADAPVHEVRRDLRPLRNSRARLPSPVARNTTIFCASSMLVTQPSSDRIM